MFGPAIYIHHTGTYASTYSGADNGHPTDMMVPMVDAKSNKKNLAMVAAAHTSTSIPRAYRAYRYCPPSSIMCHERAAINHDRLLLPLAARDSQLLLIQSRHNHSNRQSTPAVQPQQYNPSGTTSAGHLSSTGALSKKYKELTRYCCYAENAFTTHPGSVVVGCQSIVLSICCPDSRIQSDKLARYHPTGRTP